MTRDKMGETLTRHEATPELVGALLQNLLVDLEAHIGPAKSDPVGFRRGGKQGASSTPTIWRRYLHDAIGVPLSRAEQNGNGFTMDISRVQSATINHFIFADDVWIIHSHLAGLQDLVALATDGLTKANLRWKVDEKLCYTTSIAVPQPPAELKVRGMSIPWKPAVDCLGCIIPGDGDVAAVVDYRLKAMGRHYWARHSQLRCKGVPLTLRIGRYVETVRETWLYASGSLTINQAGARRIRWHDCENVRHLWRPKRRTEEEWLEWQIRTARGARALILRGGHRALLEATLARHHGWAGHVARLPPEHTVRICTAWKCGAWWRNRKECGEYWDPLNTTGWRHVGAGAPPTRWDHWLVRHYGTDWEEQAQDRERWRATRDDFVLFCHGQLGQTGELTLEDVGPAEDP